MLHLPLYQENLSMTLAVTSSNQSPYYYNPFFSEFLKKPDFLSKENVLGVINDIIKANLLSESLPGDILEINHSLSVNVVNEISKHLTKLFQGDRINTDGVKTIYELLADLSKIINNHKGNTLSLYSLLNLMKKNPRVRELVDFTIDPNTSMTFDEMSKQIDTNGKELINILSSESNEFKVFLNSNVINKGQFLQAFSLVGLKPDLAGRIIPKPINTNFAKGFTSYEEFLISARGSRKALVINYSKVGTSGYLSRKMQLLIIDERFTHEDSCDTKFGSTIFIDCEKTFNRVVNRLTFPDKTLIRSSDKDKYMNTNVEIYSPITCTSKVDVTELILYNAYIYESDYTLGSEVSKYFSNSELILLSNYLINNTEPDAVVRFNDNHYIYYFNTPESLESFLNEHKKLVRKVNDSKMEVDTLTKKLTQEIANHCNISVYRKKKYTKKGICKTCYGNDYKYTKQFHAGLYSEKRLSNFIIQKLLSSKHLLQCITSALELPTDFSKYFNISGGDITVQDEIDTLLIKVEKEALVLDNELDYNFVKFTVVDPETKEEIVVNMDSELPIYVKEGVIDFNSSDPEYYFIEVSDNDEDPVLYFKINNIEISKTMKKVIKLIEFSPHTHYNDMLNEFSLLANEAGFGEELNLSAMEIVIRALLRNKNNLYQRPDFSDPNLDFNSFSIMGLQPSILNGSPSGILAFERFRQKQKNIVNIESESILDNIFC